MFLPVVKIRESFKEVALEEWVKFRPQGLGRMEKDFGG